MSNKLIRHVIPQIGVQELTLYSPADEIYSRLNQSREIRRLIRLRHLGALSHAFPGIRQTRWDYSVAMLFFSEEMRVPGMSSSFKLGRIRFSSAIAALQSLAIVWNSGHLPGTFSVEKGVHRFLTELDPDNPADVLIWPFAGTAAVDRIKRHADQTLRSSDYLGISRVLAVNKLLGLCKDPSDPLFDFCEDFAAPFLLDSAPGPSIQWGKLALAFRLVRHLAYLTLDAPFTGLTWSPGIPALFRQTISEPGIDLSGVDERVREVLSPIERSTYASIYHSPEARREAVLTADLTYRRLRSLTRPEDEIRRWMRQGLFQELHLGRRPSPQTLKRVASIKLRSHFATWPEAPVVIEAELRRSGITHPGVFEYKAWNTQALLEPDEKVVDLLTSGSVGPDGIGKLLIKLISNIDDLDQEHADSFSMLVKNDLEVAYASLLSRAVALRFEGILVDLEPWPLRQFGLFPSVGIARGRGAIWASNAKLDDQYARHILRDRRRYVSPDVSGAYAELLGISALRARLRRKWTGRDLRQRCLIITASVRLRDSSRQLIEFDGGLMKISARSGRMVWYGLETKTGPTSALRSLDRKLQAIGVTEATFSMTARHAYVEIPL